MTDECQESDHGLRSDDAKFRLWKAQGLDLRSTSTKTSTSLYIAVLGALTLFIVAFALATR